MKYLLLLQSVALSVACSGGSKGSKSKPSASPKAKSPAAVPMPAPSAGVDKSPVVESFSLKSPVSDIAQDANPVFSFDSLAEGDIVGLFSDAGCGNLLGKATASGDSLEIKLSLPEDGAYRIHATRSTPGLADSDCSSFFVNYTLDRAISPISAVSVVSATSNDSTPVVTVSGADFGDSVFLFTDENCLSSSQVGFGIAAEGSLDITLSSSALPNDASYDFYARSSDPAGNQSACSTATVRYTLDTVAPASPNSVVLNSGVSNTTTPSFQIGGLILGNTVNLYKDSNCANQVASLPISNTSMAVVSAALESDGVYQFHATQTDEAGNISACSSASASYSLDASNPSLSNITFTAGGLDKVAVNGVATLDFKSSEPLDLSTSTVSIHGKNAIISETGHHQYQASYKFTSDDASANPVSFTITYRDLSNNSGPDVSATTGGETVAYNNSDYSPSLDLSDKSLSEVQTLLLDINDTSSGGDVDGGEEAITYSCFYDLVPDSRVSDSLSCSLIGVTLDASTGNFSWTPSYNQAGEYELKIVATDGKFKGDSVFKVSVANVNRAPAISNQGNKKLSENQTFTKNFRDVNTNTDNDIDGDIINYRCYYDDNIDGIVGTENSCSEISGLNFNEANGLFSWAVKPSNAGIYDIKVVASDGDMSSETIFKVTVTVDISKQPQLSMVGSNTISYFSSLSDNNEVTIAGQSLGIKNAGDTFEVNTSAGDLLQCSGGCFAMTPIDGTAAWSTKTYAATLLSTYIGREPAAKVVVAAFENPAFVVIKQRNAPIDSANIPANSIHTFIINNPHFEALVIESDQDVSAYVSSGSGGNYDRDGRVITAASKQSLGFVSGGGGTPSGITTTVDNTTINAYRADGENFENKVINLAEVLEVTNRDVSQNDWESAIAIYSNQPTVSTQHADSDGQNSTPSLPKSMLSTHFVTPMEGDYVSFAAYDPAEVIVIDGNDNVITKLQMQRAETAHEKAPYAISYNESIAIPKGTKFICTEPCLAIFEPEGIDDETLMTGALNTPLLLSSNDFENDTNIPSTFEGNQAGCSGQNSFPHLQWENLPWGTKSLAIIVEDKSTGKVHLNLSNIDPASAEIPQLTASMSFPSGTLGSNGFSETAWTGVCGASTEYSFKIYALKSPLPSPIADTKSADFELNYGQYIIGSSTLNAKY